MDFTVYQGIGAILVGILIALIWFCLRAESKQDKIVHLSDEEVNKFDNLEKRQQELNEVFESSSDTVEEVAQAVDEFHEAREQIEQQAEEPHLKVVITKEQADEMVKEIIDKPKTGAKPKPKLRAKPNTKKPARKKPTPAKTAKRKNEKPNNRGKNKCVQCGRFACKHMGLCKSCIEKQAEEAKEAAN